MIQFDEHMFQMGWNDETTNLWFSLFSCCLNVAVDFVSNPEHWRLSRFNEQKYMIIVSIYNIHLSLSLNGGTPKTPQNDHF